MKKSEEEKHFLREKRMHKLIDKASKENLIKMILYMRANNMGKKPNERKKRILN